MKSIRGLLLSCFSILLIITACQRSDDQEPILETESRAQVRSAWEIPGLLNAIAPYVNPSFSDRGDISSANQANTYFGMSIDLESIKSRIDSSNYTNYSMVLKGGVYSPQVIKNLVIGQDGNGQWKVPMLMTYTMSDAFYEQYAATGLLEGFSGTIKKEQLRPLNYQTQRSGREPSDNEGDPDDYGSDRDQPDTTCPEETVVTSGGGTTTTGSSGTLVEVCEVFVVTVYSTDGHGNRYIHDQYLTYENCRTEEQFSSSDGENCEEPTGEIPINEEDEEGPDCSSFNYRYLTSDQSWQAAGVKGFRFKIVVTSTTPGEPSLKTITLSWPEPILFGLPTFKGTKGEIRNGQAATLSAELLEDAINNIGRRYKRTTTAANTIKIEFEKELKRQFEWKGGRVNFNDMGSSPVIVTQYETRLWGTGNCD